MAQINLTAALNFDDSDYKRGVKSVEQSLKKFSTATAFVKLKLDDRDFRKQYQSAVADLQKKMQKAGALSYTTKSGKVMKADTIGTMQTAYKYFLDQSQNSSLSTAEINSFKKKEELMRNYLNLLKLIGEETKRNSQLERERANMGLRMARAQMSGQVEAERRRVASARKAANEIPNIEARIAKFEQERSATKNIKNNTQQVNAEIAAVGRLLSEYEKYLSKIKQVGSQRDIAKIQHRVNALREEHTRLKQNSIALREYNRQTGVTKGLNDIYLRQGNLLSRLGLLASRYFSIYTVINFGKKIAEITGYFQQQQVALEGILGSASEAQRVINELKSLALESPKQTKELITYAKQLSAFGIESKDLTKVTKSLADISVGLGVDMNRIILAYGQVKSAAVLRGQELRQFTEAGIPMVKALAEKLTELNGELVTTADVFELISKRKVSFEVVADVLNDMTKEGGKFYKMQETVTDTLAGQMAKLKDLWTISLEDIGKDKGGLFNGIVQFLQRIVKEIKTVAAAMLVMIPVAAITNQIRTLRTEFALLSIKQQRAIGGWTNYARNMLMTNLKMGAVGAAISIGAGLIAAGVQKIKHELTKISKKMKEISNSFTEDTNRMLDGVNALLNKMRTATKGSKDWNDAVETLKNNYGEYIDVNDTLIQSLYKGSDALSVQVDKYKELNEQIAASIKLQKEFEELQAKKEAADALFSEDAKKQFKVSAQQILTNLSGMGLDYEKILGENYDKKAFSKLSEKIEDVYINALIEFTQNEKETQEDFLEIFKRLFGNAFMTADMNNEKLNAVIKLVTDRAFTNITTGKFGYTKEFEEYLSIIKKITGKGSSDLDYVLRINRMFEQANFVPQSSNLITNYYDQDKFYRELFYDQYDEEDKLIRKGLFAEFDDIIKRENTEKAKSALNNLKAIVASTTTSTRDIQAAMISLYEAIGDPVRRSIISKAAELYKKHTIALTKDQEALAKRLQSVSDFSGENDLQSYFERWNPILKRDKTLEQIRDEIAQEYDTLEKQKKSYESEGKDENSLFKDEYDWIVARMKVLEKIAQSEYYDVELSEGKGGKNKTLPTDIAELINEMKTAYTRYKEVTQIGGVDFGLEYVRNNEYFKKTFGAFFGGEGSEEFQKIAGIKIGDKTAGDILKDKFRDGLEDGIIDFHAALSGLQKELEEYGKADEKHRKSFLSAAKTLAEWIDNTFSKDNLNATLLELHRELKSLTNTFSKTNKVVDLYRKLQEKGTSKTLGKNLGVTKEQAVTPDSIRFREQALQYIAAYNSKLPEAATGFRPESLESIDDIYNALDKLSNVIRLNDAFDASGVSKEAGEEIKKMLEQLLEAMIRELSGISSEVFSGNTMQDMIANTLTKYDILLSKAESTSNTASAHGTIDMSAIKELATATQEEAKAIFEQFMKDNRLDIIAGKDGKIDTSELEMLEEKLGEIAKKFPKALQDELLSKLTNLRSEVDKYNASIGAYGIFAKAIQGYRGAKDYAKKEYGLEEVNREQIKGRIVAAELGLTDENINELNTELALSEKRLEEMGENGKILAEELEKASLENLNKSVQECQQQFQSIVGIVNSLVGAAKAFSNTINKVYDVMHDGENPEWMQEMDGFLNDFGEAFDNLIAPITSVISLIAAMTTAMAALGVTATVALWWMAGIVAVAAVIAGVIAAFQSHDRKLQRTIEDLDLQIKELENAITNLDAAAERMVGLEKQEAQLKSLALTYEQYIEAVKKARAEDAKHNSEKSMEYWQEAQEYLDEFLNGIHDWREEVLFSVTDMSNSIAQAFRSAFQSGENAAREMAAVVKQSIGDMVMNMIETTYLQPAIQSLMEEFFGGTAEQLKDRFSYTDKDGNKKYDSKKAVKYFMTLLSDEEHLKNLESDFGIITTGLIDFTEGLGDTLEDYLKFNSDTSSLSSGISGITEDTARTLEGIGHSTLMQLVMANQHLSIISSSGFAQVQVSWFNDMLAQTKAIRNATENLNNAVSDMRNGVRPMSVKVV